MFLKDKRREYLIVPFTVIALFVDLLGRVFAEKLMLPLWCDSVGTFLIAYFAGPVCGAIVGFTNNIIYGIFVDHQSVYCVTGAFIGFLAGHFAKKKVFESQFLTMTIGMGLAVISTVISVIVSITMYGGDIGNIWAAQVMRFFMDAGFPKYVSFVIGQFYIEFLDKLFCVEIIYLLIKLVRFYRKKRDENLEEKKSFKNTAPFLTFIFALFFVFQPKPAFSQNFTDEYDSYVQTVFSNSEGLLSGEANDIEQTNDGKLWIGTYAGLFKYDGSKFKLMSDIHSVKSVNCLFVDEEGRLWTGTNDGGITIFINEHVMNVIDEESGLLSNSVKDIVCDTEGNYYIGTTEGISLVSLSGGVKITKNYEQIKNVSKMSADKFGNVVAVTERGDLFCFKNGEICRSFLKGEEKISFQTEDFSEDGRLFLASPDDSIFIYSLTPSGPKLVRKFKIPGIEGINSFYFAENNGVFVCSDTGIAFFDESFRAKKLYTNNFSNSIDAMLMDYQGNLWFSSSRLGLLEMCKSTFIELFSEIEETAVVNSTEKWQGLLFCGTDEGLIILDEENEKKLENKISSLLNKIRIRCLKVDSMDNLWIATTGSGIYKVRVDSSGEYEIKNFSQKNGLPGNRFRNICELKDGRIAVAGDYGVAFLRGDSVEKVFTAQDGFANEKSLCLLEYKNGCYVGSDGGGISKIENDKIVKNIGKKDGLSSNVILRMVYDSFSDGVFIVTSNGICYTSAKGEVKKLDNFPYSNNYDMICDPDGTCWILGSAGIFVAQSKDLIENLKTEYLLINAKHGFRSQLIANSWPCLENDNLYLCCDSGVVKVNMSKYDMASKSYRMILDFAEVDGIKHRINRSDVFKLSPQTQKLVLEPEILNYSLNDPYVRYSLDGNDLKPTECLLSELGKISYSNLKPKTYVFKISILDGLNGNVIESANYTIEKETEMYQKNWFKLYVILTGCLVLVWLTWFVTRVRAQKTLLKQKYELEYAKKQIKMVNETILSIAQTVDARDSKTNQHSCRVSEYSVYIAKKLGYSREKCETLRQMALLHDIGKIAIPDAILNKPEKLTDEEYKIMKSHVTRGAEILKYLTTVDNVSVGALYHHEKYDGSGYCHGLKGEEIPLDARIIGIADAFDAMTANRIYRKQLDLDFVIKELKRNSGTQFDPKLVDILLSLIADGTIDVEKIYEKTKNDPAENIK